jgi:PAS domain S-box-containing protein
MKFRLSIRTKLIIGLGIILLPILCFTFFNINELIDAKNKLSKEDTKTAISMDTLISNTLIYGMVMVGLSMVLLFFLAQILMKNINILNAMVEKLAKGETPEIDVELIPNDEMGDMITDLNIYAKNLNQTAQFAVSIGQGELDAKHSPLGEYDILGQALLSMRDNLVVATQKDEARNKVVICNAEVSNILRSHNNLETMGDDLLKYLCGKVQAIQGAFYIVEEDNNKTQYIKLSNLFAYNKKKYAQKTYKFGEGLVGQSAIEMDMVMRTEIPRDYVSITSGLIGENRPKCILIMPLIANEKIYGLLEFASIHKFRNQEIEVVKEVSEIIAQTIFNLNVNERTARLLQESQRMGSELKEQSMALQQNAEEMQATQEELQRTNHKLNQQIEEVNLSQKKTQALLENSSEVIMVIDASANCLYVSPSIPKILGHSTDDILSAKNILHHIHDEDKTILLEIIEEVMANPSFTQNAELRIKKENGEYVYTESTIKNMVDEPAISGIVLNVRDISARKEAEKEARMRSQMQSLSENSPDLITRINSEGRIYYINPTIEKLTSYSPTQLLRQYVNDTNLEDNVKETWMTLVKDVVDNKCKVNIEMQFPTEAEGKLVMSVNAIPEFGDNENVESILLVSSDITERKKNEVEIQNKNKKITESINYAKRIQVAILPDYNRIKELFPNYFMYYKPRDVVSGDFPWFVESGDDIFIAAVDCTGHGVPGAMLSLIGYFLLNDIVKSQKILEPGTILDMLDSGVTQTLKQDMEGNEMKDGMDISLCRINKKKGILQYAGAHRPLYMLRNNEIIEFKGDKFPIGGGIYKNQTEFTNHNIEYQSGDAFFFCSDGFPDQFGGPDNKKIGPSKIKQLIVDTSSVEFDELYDKFGGFFEGWMGNHKQMDDVLMIGLKITK